MLDALAPQLADAVNGAASRLLTPLPIPITLGDPALDSVTQQIAAVTQLASYSAIAPQVVAVMQRPDFLAFVHGLPPEMVAALLPPKRLSDSIGDHVILTMIAIML